jgi:hypothetical protein
MLPEVRMARIVEAIGRYRGGQLSCVMAARLLGDERAAFFADCGIVMGRPLAQAVAVSVRNSASRYTRAGLVQRQSCEVRF